MKAKALLGLSCYLWYLVFYVASFGILPTPGLLTAQLLLVFLLPVALARALNIRLFGTGPTVLQAVLRNAAQFLVYTLLTVWSFFWLDPGWVGDIGAGIYHCVWQALMWLVGIRLVFLDQSSPPSDSPLGTVALSAAAALAFLLLTAMGFSAAILLVLFGGWYFCSAFSLALRGEEPARRGVVVLHSLVPFLLAGLAVLFVFSGSLDLLLQGAKSLLLAVWHFLVGLLMLIKLPEGELPPLENEAWVTEIIEQAAERQPAGGWLFLVLGAILLAMLTLKLIQWLGQILRMRIARPRRPVTFRPRLSLWRWILDAAGALMRILKGLVGLIRRALRGAVRAARRAGRRAAALVSALLPPKTPGQAVVRSYLRFLRWGGRMRIRRRAAETPLEYLGRLETLAGRRLALEEARELTGHFLQVQYGGSAVDWTTAAICRRLLWRIRRPAKGFCRRLKTASKA